MIRLQSESRADPNINNICICEVFKLYFFVSYTIDITHRYIDKFLRMQTKTRRGQDLEILYEL